MSLIDIKPGKIGIVTEIGKDTNMRRRFQDLGIVNGTEIKCIGKSPLGDPTAYLIKRAVIALREEDAREIYVKELN